MKCSVFLLLIIGHGQKGSFAPNYCTNDADLEKRKTKCRGYNEDVQLTNDRQTMGSKVFTF